MIKDKFYKDFKEYEIIEGYSSMIMELNNAPYWIKSLFYKVWLDFINNNFSYDGATFVPERYKNTIFEVASFIHDWFNYKGYVGYKVDKLFVLIMRELDYKRFHINLRKILMIFTFLNIIIHIFDSNKKYLGDIDINHYKPPLLC